MPAIPKGYNLHLSNGTPIRYAQLFDTPQLHAVWCNRGVSGIDGCTATALGSAMATATPTLLITGDTSATYDIGALLQLPVPPHARIIVMCNGGGDIFRFIGATRATPGREQYLCAADKMAPLGAIGAVAGLRVFEARSEEELQRVLPEFFGGECGAMLLVHTEGDGSADVLRKYMARCKGIDNK